MKKTDEQFLTIKQAAERLSISGSSVRQAIMTGKIRAYKFGTPLRGVFRIPEVELNKYINSCKVPKKEN